MSKTTKETRLESYCQIACKVDSRHSQCVQGLYELGCASARELADYLFERGLTPTRERNYTHPRLNELVKKGVVGVIGKKLDEVTNRNVAIYKLNSWNTK